MKDLVTGAIGLLARHPAVPASSWPGRDPAGRVGATRSLPVYQVLLRGPTKVEYLFLEHSQEPMPPVEPSRETLVAINTHFWDWIWWLATKASVGRDDLVADHLPQLDAHLLRPIGVTTTPKSIDAAIGLFVARRDALEREYGVSVPRALEDEVRRGLRRIDARI